MSQSAIRGPETPSYLDLLQNHTDKQSSVDFWIATLEKNQTRAERDKAVNFLMREGVVAVDSLICLLHDEDQDIRERAIDALGQIGSQRATEPLLSCLQDRASGVRKRAVLALGTLGDPRARFDLMKLQRDVDPRVRKAAAKALKMLKEA